jgi:hypothetical protein
MIQKAYLGSMRGWIIESQRDIIDNFTQVDNILIKAYNQKKEMLFVTVDEICSVLKGNMRAVGTIIPKNTRDIRLEWDYEVGNSEVSGQTRPTQKPTSTTQRDTDTEEDLFTDQEDERITNDLKRRHTDLEMSAATSVATNKVTYSQFVKSVNDSKRRHTDLEMSAANTSVDAAKKSENTDSAPVTDRVKKHIQDTGIAKIKECVGVLSLSSEAVAIVFDDLVREGFLNRKGRGFMMTSGTTSKESKKVQAQAQAQAQAQGQVQVSGKKRGRPPKNHVLVEQQQLPPSIFSTPTESLQRTFTRDMVSQSK